MKRIIFWIQQAILTPAIVVSVFGLYEKGYLDSNFEKLVVFIGLSILVNLYINNLKELLS